MPAMDTFLAKVIGINCSDGHYILNSWRVKALIKELLCHPDNLVNVDIV